MSFNAFVRSWNRIHKIPDNSSLKRAVKYWCIELELDETESISVEKNIYEWIQNSHIISFLLNIAKQFELLSPRKAFWSGENSYIGDLTPEEFSQYIGEKQEAMERQNNVNAVLLIAFVLVSVGFVINYLNEKSQQEKQDCNSSSANKYSVTSNQKNILILVINANRDDLINSLEEKNGITKADWEKLYNATQFLWVGTALEFSNSDIFNCFSRSNTVNFDTSEYDVYFIRIDLSERDSGFQPDVLQIDRRDAFQRLPETSRGISISPRLSSEAYSGKGFYNR